MNKFFAKSLPFLTAGLSLAGPAGNVAAAILGKVLNVQSPTSKTIAETLNNLTLSPELQAQLQEAEKQYALQMQQMGYQHEDDLAKLAADDTADARAMQTSVKSWVPATLAILVTVGFFSLLTLMIFHSFPKSSESVLDVMTGSLGTAWITMIHYYFGSSSGSDRKTELLAQQ